MKLPSRFASRRHAAGVLAACALLLGACSDGDQASPLSPDSQNRASAAAATADPAQRVARAFAAAMQDADVRVQVRNAMRGSLYNEHKLVLQEFVATRAGRRLVQAAAKGAGMTEGELDALIATLPVMDFYAPFQTHRLTWRGNADVAVGSAMDVDAPRFTAYTADGQQLVHGAGGTAPQTVWLFIHPAEPKSLRQAPQANTPGSVIQEPNDGTVSTQDENCSTCITEPGDDGTGGTGGGGGGGGGTGTGATMVLEKFYSNVFDGIGASELRFIVRNASHTELAAHRWDGIEPNYWSFHTVNYTFPRGAYLQLREIDTFDSDDKGTFPIYVIPGWVSAELVDCYPFYNSNNYDDPELMCGPRSWDPMYAPEARPHWSAYLR